MLMIGTARQSTNVRSTRELLPIEACTVVKSFFCETKDGKLKLKLNHNYYYQIQGVLSITEISLFGPHRESLLKE